MAVGYVFRVWLVNMDWGSGGDAERGLGNAFRGDDEGMGVAVRGSC